MKKILPLIIAFVLCISFVPINRCVSLAEEMDVESSNSLAMGDNTQNEASENTEDEESVMDPKTETNQEDEDYITISSAEDLKNISKDLNGKYILQGDIDLSGEYFETIGSYNEPFEGELNGNGHTIKNFILDGNNCGIFARNSGLITNLGIYNGLVKTAQNKAGVITAVNEGIIDGCYVHGLISAYTDSNKSYAGLVAGDNKDGKITNVFSIGILAVDSSAANKSTYAGGIAGINSGEISLGYSIASFGGKVSDDIMTKLGSNTNMTCPKDIKANKIAGLNNGKINNCYGIGESDAQCTLVSIEKSRNKSAYDKLDFEQIWTIDNNGTYSLPRLKEVPCEYELKRASDESVTKTDTNRAYFKVGDKISVTVPDIQNNINISSWSKDSSSKQKYVHTVSTADAFKNLSFEYLAVGYDKGIYYNDPMSIRAVAPAKAVKDKCIVVIDPSENVKLDVYSSYNGEGSLAKKLSKNVYLVKKGIFSTYIKETGYYRTVQPFYVRKGDITKGYKTISISADKIGGNGYENNSSALFTWNPEVENKFYSETGLKGYERPDTPSMDPSKAKNEFLSISDRYAYLNKYTSRSDKLYLYDLDTDTPVVFFTTTDLSGVSDPFEAARKLSSSNKLKIFFQAQIHGDEPAAGEAALYYISKLAGSNGDIMAQDADIVIIPCVNIEGGKAYSRYNQGIDMNRDAMALNTTRMQLVHRLTNEFVPDVALDDHESYYKTGVSGSTGNISYLDDVKIRGTASPNMSSSLNSLSASITSKAISGCNSKGLRAFYYQTSGTTLWSTNYYGLNNSCSFIVESVGRLQGKPHLGRRVFANYTAVDQVFKNCIANKDAIKTATNASRKSNITKGSTYSSKNKFVLRHKTGTAAKGVRPVLNIDGTVISSKTVGSRPTYSKSARSRALPTAYVIPKNASNSSLVAKRLKMNGIDVYELKAGATVKTKKYSGTRTKAKLGKATNVTFKSGAYFIPLNQPERMVIAASLEPDINDNYSDIKSTLTYKLSISSLYRVEVNNPLNVYNGELIK